MDTVTHIAGPALTIGGRIIQRCALCGEKLVDSLNCMVPMNNDGTIPTIGIWEPGRLIQVTVDKNPTRYLMLPDGEQLPEDTCLDLVE